MKRNGILGVSPDVVIRCLALFLILFVYFFSPKGRVRDAFVGDALFDGYVISWFYLVCFVFLLPFSFAVVWNTFLKWKESKLQSKSAVDYSMLFIIMTFCYVLLQELPRMKFYLLEFSGFYHPPFYFLHQKLGFLFYVIYFLLFFLVSKMYSKILQGYLQGDS